MQPLPWAFEQAEDQKRQLWVVYLDFANVFNSVDHEALWRWLQELNVPDLLICKDPCMKSSTMWLIYHMGSPLQFF